MERVYSAVFGSSEKYESSALANLIRKARNVDFYSKNKNNHNNDDVNNHKKNIKAQEIDDTDLVLVSQDFELVDLHEEIHASIRAGIRVFMVAYGAKSFTAVLLAPRIARQDGLKAALSSFFKKDTFRFGAFVGVMVTSFRLSLLLLNEIGCQSEKKLAIAGGISGLAILLDSPKRRKTVSLYVFLRSLEVFGQFLTQEKIIPEFQYSSEVLFSLCSGPIMYACLLEPHLLSKSYVEFFLNMGSISEKGLYMLRKRWLYGSIDENGVEHPFQSCAPYYHHGSCEKYAGIDWFKGLGRAMKIYIPVHLLPVLIFKYKQLYNAPKKVVSSTGVAIMKSSMFLTSYQILVKYSQCRLRKFFQEDYSITPWIGGWFSGCSLLIEDPKRRSELALYCLPHALTVIWSLLKRKRLVKVLPHWEAILFSMAMALILSIPTKYIRPLYLHILQFLFHNKLFPI